MKQQEVIAGFREERERLVEYLQTLDDTAWETPSLCEGWTVRELYAHLVANAADAAAFRVEGMGSPEFNQRQVDERADRTPQQLLEEHAEQAALLDGIAESMTPETWESELPGFDGRTLGWGVQRLLEDIWVHAQDIRIPLGAPMTSGPGLDATLEVIASELPERLRRHAPAVAVVELAAGGQAFKAVASEGGAAVRISGDPGAIALVATGRLSLSEATQSGKVSVTPGAPKGLEAALNVYLA